MSENNSNEELFHHYKNNSELSSDDLNSTNSIILNDYQPFIIGDYYFIIGATQNESLYFECTQKNKYYKLLISKNNLCIINEKFNLCKDIDEIYKLILNSINEIKIVSMHNNKLKFTLSVIFEKTSYPFEIILKEETNKNALLLSENKIKFENSLKDKGNNLINNELVLIEENDETSELKKEKSSSVNEEESQDPSHKNEFYLVNYNVNNNEQIKDAIKNLSGKEEENEDEEDEEDREGEDIEGPSETTNIQNETNKIYNIINELKKDIKYLKGIITKYETTNNNEKINELELKNDDLLKEINKIKKELKIVSEENKKNKEEINILKKNIPSCNSIKGSDNNKLENSSKDIKNKALSKSQLIKPFSNIETNQNSKNSKMIKLKKMKKFKPKSQRKSILFTNNFTDEDSLYSINEFIFKQKYKIKETDSELDLTNKKLGDKGLEELGLIKFTELTILSLDTNKIFSIKPLTNLTLSHLEVLNLDNNYISDISSLEYCKFPSLQILWLNNNNIADISVFERVKFNQLKHLYLNNNNITDISVLKKVNFNNLERLYLKNNKIENISCIVDFDMNKLQLVYLNKNKINFNLSVNKEIISKLQKKIKYFSY